jgi:nitrogen permease regulator 2-like protein
VPIALTVLGRAVDKYWDMSMRRIIPYINGVLSIKQISEYADVETELVRLSIKHLL